VAELVDDHHHADENDECNNRNQKLMHKCVDFSRTSRLINRLQSHASSASAV
jgi:hypothetical protein